MESRSIKRPVNLLCLSDLHLDSHYGKWVLNKLRLAVAHLGDEEKNILWKPDFIVLAGDLIEAKNRDKKDYYYKELQIYLETLINDFQLTPFRVIAVPGNHDKGIPCWNDSCYESDSRCTVCKELDNAQKLKEENEKDGGLHFDFLGTYNNHFEKFGKFYHHFAKENRGKGEEYCSPPELQKGNNKTNIALTSGLKVFDECKICFLCINTEWTYFPDKERRFDEGFLCSQIVHSSLEHFIQNYNGYTLVTVMHRNPCELSWNTKFRTKPIKPNILRNLYQYSDIILTGHNHTERLLPPDRMENHAQLFQLGPVSMSPRDGTLPLYHASLIHVNPLAGFVKVCNFRFNHDNHEWEHRIDGNDYQIATYPVILPHRTKPSVAESVVIPVKSFGDMDIKNALRGHFPTLTEKYECYCTDIHRECYELREWVMTNWRTATQSSETKNKAFFFYCGLPNLEDWVRQKFESLKQSLIEEKTFKYALYKKEVILIEVWFRHWDPLEIRYPKKEVR